MSGYASWRFLCANCGKDFADAHRESLPDLDGYRLVCDCGRILSTLWKPASAPPASTHPQPHRSP